MKKALSIILVIILICATAISSEVIAGAVDNNLTYSFSGDNKDTAGYAEGTISLTYSGSNPCYLYWANDTKALEGYFEIASFTKSGSVSFGEHTVIPVGATKVIASTANDSKNATVSGAIASYTLPKHKKLSYTSSDKEYSFQALSDIHIDEQDGGINTYYIYSKTHFENALEKANEHDVDFIVTSGDEITNASGATLEWLTYQKIIADSNFNKPIYEAIGNHEIRQSGEKYCNCSPNCGLEEFMLATGLNKGSSQVVADKSYFEYTEETTGDHFIFMSLENGEAPNTTDEFSNAQITWLSSLLSTYNGDGHKIYLIEHSPIQNYGAGDNTDNPGYGGALNTTSEYPNNQEFKRLIEEYPDVIWLSGHTHVDFRDDVNYSNEDGTSCHMIHVPSCCNTTRIVPQEENPEYNTLDYTFYEDTTQGYFVDSYEGVAIFNASNLYYDKIYPLYSYIIGEDPNAPEKDVPVYGDADCNGEVNVVDATCIQKSLAKMLDLSDDEKINAMVENGKTLSITDATLIQKFIAKMINVFPVEELDSTLANTGIKNEEIIITSAATTAQLNKAKAYLDAYYQYASYPEYLNIKTAYLAKDGTKINSAITAFDTLHSKVWADTVYYTDTNAHGKVKAFAWGSKNIEDYPGQRATWVKTNSVSQEVYAVTVDFAKYKNIIFSDGGNDNKTEDIVLDGCSGKQYFPISSKGPYIVSQTTFSKMWYADSSKNITIYFTNTKDWSNLKCYYWNGSKNNTWPGKGMDFVRNSSSNKGIYKMTVPADASVIFNSDGDQTVDITSVVDGYGYYVNKSNIKDGNNHYYVTQYKY